METGNAPPAPDTPLAEMMGAAPPEHDVRGRIMIVLIYAGAAALFGDALWSAVTEPFSLARIVPLLVLIGCTMAVAAFLAEGLRRFRCWAWFFVAGWLALGILCVLPEVMHAPPFRPDDAAELAVLMMLAGGLRYLWGRRWDFWMDGRLQSRRRVPRRVSREWRAARLAAIGTPGRAGRSNAALPRAARTG